MEKERVKNPVKQMAIHLAHQMDDERSMFDENLPPWKEEEIRECGRQLRTEIFQKGYDINELLFLAEEYKTLSWDDYYDWLYR